MSVFTFDTDPPRVASPWLRPAEPGRGSKTDGSPRSGGGTQSGSLSDYGVTKLEAEPQDGPTEYKLHLLLRPRRPFEYMSTAKRVSGSIQSRPPLESKSTKSAPAVITATISNQSRQDRLTHLTTQLLWRLQQSCPYNPGSAAAELVVPQLPDDALTSTELPRIGKLPPGLEASRGALYEIGVADDGELIGLTKDELDESLKTLGIMASSLGCNMEVLREVIVGDCQWIDMSSGEGNNSLHTHRGVRCQGKLWVAEALVTPDLAPPDLGSQEGTPSRSSPKVVEELPDPKLRPLTSNQLRVTLTGPTTSGKSTLLGTLSTGALDNARGKIRQNLLKHAHELVSGVTSSVTQEIIGYNASEIVNYAHGGIESWIDIHDYTKDGRLVYLTDSAGHPRYRRTILRGIVGWAPQWTLLCIAADDGDNASGPGATASSRDIFGVAGAGVDLAQAHLDLCLQLQTPLVIVITKLDLASKQSVARVLGKVLSRIKGTGRTVRIVKSDHISSEGETEIPSRDHLAVKQALSGISEDLLSIVPIVITSAVRGDGLGALHALLRELPLPRTPTSYDFTGEALNPEQPTSLFHIEDKYSIPASYSLAVDMASQPTDMGTVVAGYMRFGNLSVGDRVLVGPFPADDDDARGLTPEDRPSPGSYGLSISHPSSAELARIAQRNAVSASTIKGEWHNAQIVSVRNLRLPVQTLEAGQVGSIGIIFDTKRESSDGSLSPTIPVPRPRKGMVMAIPNRHMIKTGLSLQAASGLTVHFDSPDAASLQVGSLVNIYVASVRTAARIVTMSGSQSPVDASGLATEDIDDVFTLSEELDVAKDRPESTASNGVDVRFELLTNREWIELGSRIVVLEGGSRDRSGLEGFVGKVIEIVD